MKNDNEQLHEYLTKLESVTADLVGTAARYVTDADDLSSLVKLHTTAVDFLRAADQASDDSFDPFFDLIFWNLYELSGYRKRRIDFDPDHPFDDDRVYDTGALHFCNVFDEYGIDAADYLVILGSVLDDLINLLGVDSNDYVHELGDDYYVMISHMLDHISDRNERVHKGIEDVLANYCVPSTHTVKPDPFDNRPYDDSDDPFA